MKVLLFGTGDCYQKYKKWFDHVEVTGILDNDESRAGTILDGKKVMLPSEGVKEDYDYIYILSIYEDEIREQLVGLGVPGDKIFHYFDIVTHLKPGKKPIQTYGCCSGNETALFLFYDLNFNGASIAFLNMIRVMKNIGKNVVAASMNDGGLRSKLSELKVPVIIDANMQVSTFADIAWAQNFTLVFCNTINFYYMLSNRKQDIPFIWWVHEPEIFYAGIKENIFRNILAENLFVYAAGPVAASAYHKFRPEDDVKILLYGLPDRNMANSQSSRDNRTVFAMIGNLQIYKAQDVYIDAILSLSPIVRKKAKFYIIGGHGKSQYAAELHKKAGQIAEIAFLGELAYEEIHKILDKIDILVCPSRQDTMPTVVAEAMMHGVTCIMSDHVGTASLISRGEEGIVFECDNVLQLTDEMEKCIHKQYDLEKLGRKARKAYEDFFSMDVFQENITNEIPYWLPGGKCDS